jgi:hypothetical protein
MFYIAEFAKVEYCAPVGMGTVFSFTGVVTATFVSSGALRFTTRRRGLDMRTVWINNSTSTNTSVPTTAAMISSTLMVYVEFQRVLLYTVRARINNTFIQLAQWPMISWRGTWGMVGFA